MTIDRSQQLPALDLRGPRVLLRPWRASDLAPFGALNADPEVMEYLPGPLSREESDAVAARIDANLAAHGFTMWALEVPGEVAFAGFVGLFVPNYEAHFTPCVEVGWRLARAHWGKGYAIEGARVALQAAFGPLGLEEVVSLTVPANVRSRRVMERLGMRRSAADDFDHPRISEGNRLRRHVLYRLTREEWALRDLEAPEDRNLHEVHEEREDHGPQKQSPDDGKR
jgi:RimJ/RimL family protein N-acetyltransferase